jgi:hypothetical protein
MSSPATHCKQCGAATTVPADLNVLQMVCPYCSFSQPVPDFVERQRALQQHQFQAATQASVLASVQSAQKMGANITKIVMIFVVLILLLTFGIVAFTMFS